VKKRGEVQPGGLQAEHLPAETFHIYVDPENKEASVYTGTERNRPVGWMSHDPVRGTVDTVYVHPDFRGKGLGPRMYAAAGSPPHSENLTEAGERFARKVGGAQPAEVKRQEPLHEAGHITMLPDFARWVKESPTARRHQ
jgi:GNAT superfamily N-acetyltransferase